MEYVRNDCYGGFGLSEMALRLYNEYAGTELEDEYDIPRNDPFLVKVVKELGKTANADHAELVIVNIPDEVKPELHEYDGWEHFAEPHRTW